MTKYAIPEIEKRRIANKELLPDLSLLPWSKMEDRYIDGTRMRLRKQINSDGTIVYKLCKKYWKKSAISEEIVNTYLTEDEYMLFVGLPATTLSKTRYFDKECDINIFEDGKITIEREFTSEQEATNFVPPAYCGADVSSNLERESATISQS